MAVVYSSAAESALDLYSETFWDSSLVSAMSLAFSFAGAEATFLPISFCWARASSKAFSASRRAVSEESTSSTSSTDSPRLRWDSLTISVCSRMN